jgi:hypothetical protein
MGAVRTGSRLGGEGGGGEIHGPEHQAGGGEIDSAGVHDTEDFSAVQGEVATGHGHAKSSEAGEAAGTGHVVEEGAGVEVMAATGASADGWSVAVASVGKGMAADNVRVFPFWERLSCAGNTPSAEFNAPKLARKERARIWGTRLSIGTLTVDHLNVRSR